MLSLVVHHTCQVTDWPTSCICFFLHVPAHFVCPTEKCVCKERMLGSITDFCQMKYAYGKWEIRCYCTFQILMFLGQKYWEFIKYGRYFIINKMPYLICQESENFINNWIFSLLLLWSHLKLYLPFCWLTFSLVHNQTYALTAEL